MKLILSTYQATMSGGHYGVCAHLDGQHQSITITSPRFDTLEEAAAELKRHYAEGITLELDPILFRNKRTAPLFQELSNGNSAERSAALAQFQQSLLSRDPAEFQQQIQGRWTESTPEERAEAQRDAERRLDQHRGRS